MYRIYRFLKKKIHRWETLAHSVYMSNAVNKYGTVGSDSRFCRGVEISGIENLHLGDNVGIGSGTFIRAEGGLTIGDNTIISRNCVLYTINHDFEGTRLPFDSTMIKKPVRIGKNVWIGMNVCIVPGTTIGDGVIVGMGTTVHGEVPPYSIIGSSGYRIIGSRDMERYERLNRKKAFCREDGLPWEKKK